MFRFVTLLIALLLTWAGGLASPALGQTPEGRYAFPQPDRLVIVGLVGGDLEAYRETLRDKALIDENDQWTGGQTHYVQAGDMFLLGDEVLPTLRLLHSLSEQAAEAGGRVTTLLNPSMLMALRGDISNIPHDNYKEMAGEDSEEKLEEFLRGKLDQLWEYNADFQEQTRKELQDRYASYFRRTHSPGAVEFMEAIAPNTALGEWIRASPAVIRVGSLIISYGGVSEEYATMSLTEINQKIRKKALREYIWVPKMADLKSPLWWKGLSAERPEDLKDRVESILSNLNARAMVVAHSPKAGESMKQGRVYHIQSGLTPDLEERPLIAALEVAEGRWLFTVGERKFLTQPPEPLVPEPAPAPDDAG